MIDCDPDALMQQARCLDCLSPWQLRFTRAWLLCHWAGGNPPVPPGSEGIMGEGGEYILGQDGQRILPE